MLKLNKLFRSFCLLAVLPMYLGANSCDKRAFDIKIENESTSAYEIISQLSKVCNFSVIYKDLYAKNKLQAKGDGINIRNMDINDVFDLLIDENGLSYDYTGKILRIEGLKTKTFKINYITSVRKGSAITKANVESQSSSSSGSNSSNSSSSSDSDNMIETTEEFDFWKNIGQEISGILSNSGLEIATTPPIINSNAGLITVTSNKETLDKIGEYLHRVEDSLKKQVVIDVSIIEVALNENHKTGIDWTQFNLGFDTSGQGGTKDEAGKITWNYKDGLIETNPLASFTGLTFQRGVQTQRDFFMKMGVNLTGMINFLKKSGDAKVVSNPKISALNNQQALITVGNTYNYKLKGGSYTSGGSTGTTTDGEDEKSVFVGILLNILPEISDDNKIMLRVNPSISELLGEDVIGKNGYREIAPDTKQKKISTVVQVNDGETIVLGGLITEREMFDRNGVPILQDVPLLGHLFGSKAKVKNRSELVFVITPRIVDLSKNKDIKTSLADLGYDIAVDYDKPLKENATKDEITSYIKEKEKEKAVDEDFTSVN